MDGRIFLRVSRVFWKPASRWRKPANGRVKRVNSGALIAATYENSSTSKEPARRTEHRRLAYGAPGRLAWFPSRQDACSPQGQEGRAISAATKFRRLSKCVGGGRHHCEANKVVPMFIIYIIVTIVTVGANVFAAVVDFRRPQWVADWDAINWKLPFNLFTLIERKPGTSIGRKSLCSTRAWCESRLESVRLLGDPLQLRKQASRPPDWMLLTAFPRSKRRIISLIGRRADICFAC